MSGESVRFLVRFVVRLATVDNTVRRETEHDGGGGGELGIWWGCTRYRHIGIFIEERWHVSGKLSIFAYRYSTLACCSHPHQSGLASSMYHSFRICILCDFRRAGLHPRWFAV